MRSYLGCTEEGQEEQFVGSPYQTRRCPKRAILAIPEASGVLELYHHTGGQLGHNVLGLNAALVDAIHLVAEGRCWALEQNKPKTERP